MDHHRDFVVDHNVHFDGHKQNLLQKDYVVYRMGVCYEIPVEKVGQNALGAEDGGGF